MKLLLIVLLGVATAVSAVDLTNDQSEWLFSAWMKQHNKVYQAAEVVHRYGIWSKNMEFIMNHNAKESSYRVAMNEFGDLTRSEWKQRLGTQRVVDRAPAKAKASHRRAAPPTSWDWRDHNAVNAVQNQGQCGSCWAFTSGDAVSGLWAIKTGLLFPVSVQEIVDCSGTEGNQGCNGGEMTNAFQWVIDNGGICDWQEYTYTAVDGTCMSANCTNVATIKAYQNVPANDETALMTAVWGQPVSTAVEADGQSFQFYQSGVIDDPACGTQLDHGVTLVGWGTDATLKKDYWQVRNMWGAAWGEKGYVRIVRAKNMCGIAMQPTYPTL